MSLLSYALRVRLCFLNMISILALATVAMSKDAQFMPITAAAADFIATIPGEEDTDYIRANYVAARLYLHDGSNETMLIEGRGLSVCGAANCPAYKVNVRQVDPTT